MTSSSICPVCTKVARDPCRMLQCAHWACFACLVDLKTEASPFMADQDEDDYWHRSCPTCDELSGSFCLPKNSATGVPLQAFLKAHDVLASAMGWRPLKRSVHFPFKRIDLIRKAQKKGLLKRYVSTSKQYLAARDKLEEAQNARRAASKDLRTLGGAGDDE